MTSAVTPSRANGSRPTRASTLGGPTIGWLYQAFRSFDLLNAKCSLERIALPTLIVSGTEDTVVDTQSHLTAVSRIPGAEHV